MSLPYGILLVPLSIYSREMEKDVASRQEKSRLAQRTLSTTKVSIPEGLTLDELHQLRDLYRQLEDSMNVYGVNDVLEHQQEVYLFPFLLGIV